MNVLQKNSGDMEKIVVSVWYDNMLKLLCIILFKKGVVWGNCRNMKIFWKFKMQEIVW